MSYSNLQNHSRMAFDKVRNQAYERALSRHLSPDSVVLDLGAGIGILGFIAARHGARRVHLVEPEDVLWVAESIAYANPWGDRICFHQGSIEELELPEPVDVILSVFTGNFLLEEDLLPSLFFARDRYLKPDGILLPARGKMVAVPVSAPDLHERNIGVWSEHLGVDFSSARRKVANGLIYDSKALAAARFLAAPQVLQELDFYTCQEPTCQVEVRYQITEDGLCHGWAGWFDMQLGDEWISTNPHAEHMHWNAAMLPLDPPLMLKAGEEVTFRLSRPVYGEWSWWVQTAQAEQQHSTAFAGAWGRQSLLKRVPQYRPSLGLRGKVWRDLLERFDGKTTLDEMADYLLATYPTLFRTRDQAFKTINSFVSSCS